MTDLVLVTPPASEPVVVDDLLQDLGYGPASDLDSGTLAILTGRLTPKILAARVDCENYTRRAFITQTWQLKRDGFPGFNAKYDRTGYPQILIPKPPFQSIDSFQYVDVAGVLQTLTVDVSYGNDPSNFYGYQLDPGSDGQPARVLPPFARPWPPTRLVPNNVLIQFVCGYGDAASDVPAPILMGIRFLTQFYYEQGAAVDAPLPRVVTRLLDPYRNFVA